MDKEELIFYLGFLSLLAIIICALGWILSLFGLQVW